MSDTAEDRELLEGPVYKLDSSWPVVIMLEWIQVIDVSILRGVVCEER